MFLSTALESFSSLGLEREINTLLLLEKINSYESLSRTLWKKIVSFVAKGHYLNSAGLAWTDSLHKEGYSYPAVYLSHRIASLGITTHYFSLLAEAYSFPLLHYNYQCALDSLPSFFRLRLSLAILSELDRVDLPEYLEKKLAFTSGEDIKNLPPLVILLIKAGLNE